MAGVCEGSKSRKVVAFPMWFKDDYARVAETVTLALTGVYLRAQLTSDLGFVQHIMSEQTT